LAAKRVVVIGANPAGMSAAHQALRGAASRNVELDVIAVESTHDTSYSACGIPYWIAGDVSDAVDLMARSAHEHRELGVDLRLGALAESVDLADQTVRYHHDGRTTTTAYDELVLATGARAVIPDWARAENGELIEGVHPVHTLEDGRDWRALLHLDRPDAMTTAPRTAVIVGGGYIGIEMAETLVRDGLHTTLVTRSSIMGSFDPDMRERIEKRLTAAGVEMITRTQIGAAETGADGQVRALETTDGQKLPADVVVVGVGAVPDTELGASAGLPVGDFGGYLPDATGRLAEHVWGAGDCCEVMHRLTGAYTYLPLGTHANKLGRIAGENLSGGHAEFGGALGTAITRFAAAGEHVEIARTGLSTAQARVFGRDVTSLVTEGTTASGYMPEATPIATKVLADASTRQLLGMQIVGGLGAGKRIDTAAAALWGGMSVDDVAAMDLSYAPPFSTTWEAVQIAARRLADRL
jgi:NADPH-dependent 2,4-dienoyl-CoA reductase/sulfur reductase-like enzyme